MAKKQAEKRNRVDQQDFIKAILVAKKNNESCEEVGKALGITTDSTYQRLAKYRRDGINLPNLPKVPLTRKSVEQVNDQIALMMQEMGLTEEPEPDTIPEPESLETEAGAGEEE